MSAVMDIDDSEQSTTQTSNNFPLPANTSISDFAESCDYYPPFNLTPTPCWTDVITYDSSRQMTVIVPQRNTNYFLFIGQIIHEKKSPVHRASAADGPSQARSTIRPSEHAVKVYPIDLLNNANRLGTEDPLKEIKALQFLQGRHSNILSIVGSYQEFTAGEWFLDMPLYPRGDGRQLMNYYRQEKKEDTLPLGLMKTAIRDLLTALEYLHSLGITHHDISPDQLLFDEASNRFVLIDFGMCIRQGMNLKTGCFYSYPHAHYCGKNDYWAPEIEMRNDTPCANPTKRDIWSLGPTLVFLLTGENIRNIAQSRGLEYLSYFLFVSDNMEQLLSPFEKGRGEDFASAVDFIASVMKYDPADRPTASQLLSHPWLSYIND